MNSLEYVSGDFVFTLVATANGYESYVNVYTRRHFDNCLVNGTQPWAFMGIKVKSSNGEFVFEPSQFAQFVDFCEMWISNPHETLKMVDDHHLANDKLRKEVAVKLTDFPYVGYKPRELDI